MGTLAPVASAGGQLAHMVDFALYCAATSCVVP